MGGRGTISRRLADSPSTLTAKQKKNARYRTKRMVTARIEWLAKVRGMDDAELSLFVESELGRVGLSNPAKPAPETDIVDSGGEYWDD